MLIAQADFLLERGHKHTHGLMTVETQASATVSVSNNRRYLCVELLPMIQTTAL